MHIDLLKHLKIITISLIYKVLFNVYFNLESIWFVSLHFSLMEDEYIPQRGVCCLMIQEI
jgi:hypothetical protein